MSWVRPYPEIFSRPSTHTSKHSLYDAGMVVVSQKLGRKCTIPIGSWTQGPVVCESINAICAPPAASSLSLIWISSIFFFFWGGGGGKKRHLTKRETLIYCFKYYSIFSHDFYAYRKDTIELTRPNATPMADEAKNIRQKRPTPMKKMEAPLKLAISGPLSSMMVLYNMIKNGRCIFNENGISGCHFITLTIFYLGQTMQYFLKYISERILIMDMY